MNMIFQIIHAACALIAVADKAEQLYLRNKVHRLNLAIERANRDQAFFAGLNGPFDAAVIELRRDISKLEHGVQ